MMKKIVIASTKGGVGKTTLTLNIFMALKQRGFKVALLEADKQGSLDKLNLLRESLELETIITDSDTDSDVVIIDTAGVDSKTTRTYFSQADIIITLSSQSPWELWEIPTLSGLIQEIDDILERDKTSIYLVRNKIPTHYRVKQNSLDIIDDFVKEMDHIKIIGTMTERQAYSKSIMDGLSVLEMSPVDKKSQGEINEITNNIITILN